MWSTSMPSPRKKGGSPTSRAAASPGSDLVLGIDLGATKVVSGLVDVRGRVVHSSGRHLHANDGPGGVIATLVRSARACLDAVAEPPRAVGVAVAAQVDPRTGTVVHAPNLGWRDVPLARRVGDELGVHVFVVNDARAGAYAEWQFGAGVGVADLFCLALGTGSGGRPCSAASWWRGGATPPGR